MLKFPDFNRGRLSLAAVCLWGLLSVTPLHAQSDEIDVVKGEKLYRQCQGCHAIGTDAVNGFGPQLNGVYQRGIGGVEDYDYSPEFKKAIDYGLQWDDETLDAFLAAPASLIPGTRMAFPGVASKADRSVLLDYLNLIDVDGVLPKSAKIPREVRPAPKIPAADFAQPTHGTFRLGRAALAEEVAAWDIDIRPDGAGLPAGRGSVVDGTDIYDDQCAACHGIFGEGLGRWPVLAGGQDTLLDERPEKTIGSYWPYLSTVFDYVRRAMPFGNARSLSDDDVYAVTAYLLYLNDLVEEDFVLDRDNFTSVTLPNADNFIADNRDLEAVSAVQQEPCMSDCLDGPAQITQRARVLDVTPDADDNESTLD
jgi:cytochrome c